MMILIKGKTVVLFVSLILNWLFIGFVINAFFNNSGSALSFYNMDREGSVYFTTAMIVSSPADSSIAFNAVEISLEPGQRAFLQFSGIVGKNQVNWIMETLYDRRIISVEKTGFGIIIQALETGECVLQTLGNDGIRDIAVIKVF